MAVFNLLSIVCLAYFMFHHSHSVSALSLKLMQLNEKIVLVENMTYVLTCALLSGDLHQNFFEWNHNGRKLIENSDVRVENAPKFSLLTFRNVKRHNAGQYECNVRNGDGSDQTKTKIVVHGLFFLIFILNVTNFSV